MRTLNIAASRLRILVAASIASCALLLAIPHSAAATTYNNPVGTFDAAVSSTLTYPNGHPSLTLNVWSDRNCGGTLCTATYSIWMYNSGGGLLWSAGSQGNRNYSVGSNVTRIVINRDCSCAGHNYTQKR